MEDLEEETNPRVSSSKPDAFHEDPENEDLLMTLVCSLQPGCQILRQEARRVWDKHGTARLGSNILFRKRIYNPSIPLIFDYYKFTRVLHALDWTL